MNVTLEIIRSTLIWITITASFCYSTWKYIPFWHLFSNKKHIESCAYINMVINSKRCNQLIKKSEKSCKHGDVNTYDCWPDDLGDHVSHVTSAAQRRVTARALHASLRARRLFSSQSRSAAASIERTGPHFLSRC